MEQPRAADGKDAVCGQLARRHLIDFARYIDPNAAASYSARHLAKIAEYLERVERGISTASDSSPSAAGEPKEGIKRLIIETPPRHWKSSLVSDKFPAWFLGRHPEATVLLASYAVSLAKKFSRSVRDTIEGNELYQQVFPGVKVRPDTRDATDWALEGQKRSSLRAAGVGGGMTGHGGQLLIIDDPTAGLEDALSELVQENQEQWYHGTWYNRREPNAAIVIIMQRWPGKDLVERLLEAERERGGEHWEVLRLPAVCDSPEDPIGRRIGEGLWEERFGAKFYAETQANLLPWVWNALWQQNPTEQEGTDIKRSWFEGHYAACLPDGVCWQVHAFDTAMTLKQVNKPDPDYTADVKACLHQGNLYLGEPRLRRCEWNQVVDDIRTCRIRDPRVRIGMGKALHETAALQALARQGVPIEQYAESDDPRARALAWINQASIGRVFLVGTPAQWEPFMAQWTAFPRGKHDDAVACVSGAVRMLGLVFDVTGVKPERREDPYRKIYYG